MGQRDSSWAMPGSRLGILRGTPHRNRIEREDQLSIVTTQPNAAVSPVHDRMPLVLGAGESSIWLGADFATLADRSAIQLTAISEH